MSKLTFGFIVGGDDKYYTNLMRACESLERIEQDHEILIIDAEDRIAIDDPKVKIVSSAARQVENEDDRNWFQPHIWKERYNLYKHVETDYCIYLDTDCVIINDRVDELIEEAEDNFLLTRHWWVPTLEDYFRNVMVDRTGLTKYLPEDPSEYVYGASGAFLFQKEKHDKLFVRYNEIFEDIFNTPGMHNGVTDELVLCLALNEVGGYTFTNGSFNHCAADDQQDMKLVDDIFYGKNPQEDDYKKVFAFHSAAENVDSLKFHSPGFIDQIKKVMYWEDYQ
tara:strand:- start:1370 stop:2209 length:840 start_codon:yes stop_codon:yes gene_type:complete